MSALDYYLYNNSRELSDFFASEWTRVMSKKLDSYQELRAETGYQARFGEEQIYRIAPNGDAFLQDVILTNTLSPITGGDADDAYVPAVGLNMIERIQVRHGGNVVWEIDDMTGPYLHMTTHVSDGNDNLSYLRDQINDVDEATRKSQAQGSGITVRLPLDKICPIFSHPLPISYLDGPLELRIRYKQMDDCIAPGAAGTPTMTVVDSYLHANFIEGNNQIKDAVRQMTRDGYRYKQNGRSVGEPMHYQFFGFKYLHSPFALASGTNKFRHVISNLVDKNVLFLWFTRREDSDMPVNPYNFKKIAEWSLKSSGKRIDNQNKDWTDDAFNNWYIGSLKLRNLYELKDKYKYFINYTEDPTLTFSAQGNAELVDYHGAFSFQNISDATLEIQTDSNVTSNETLDVTAEIPVIVSIKHGRLSVIE